MCPMCSLYNIKFNYNTKAVSLGTLRLVSKTMAQQVPTLSMIIPYVELSTKQGYLVDRIKGSRACS